MDLVEIGQRVVFLCEGADRGDRRDVPVHRVDALEGNDLGCLDGHRLEKVLEVAEVIVAKDVLQTPAMADALDHRGMVLLVGEDHKARDQADQRREGRLVGDIGAGEEESGFLAVKVGELGFEFHVVMGRAGDVTRAAGARAHRIDGLVHGRAHLRVLAHAEIVVGAPDGDVAGAFCGVVVGDRIGPAAALQVGKNAIPAFLVQGLKVLAEAILVIHLSPFPRPLAFANGTQLLAEQNGYGYARPDCASSCIACLNFPCHRVLPS